MSKFVVYSSSLRGAKKWEAEQGEKRRQTGEEMNKENLERQCGEKTALTS